MKNFNVLLQFLLLSDLFVSLNIKNVILFSTEGMPYQCEICDEKLGSKHNYKMHKINVHAEVRKKNQ